jgi:hypothetical protein
MKSALTLLGTSPSRVVHDHPAAAPVRATGYEVTDFAGLFNSRKRRFLVTRGTDENYLAIEDDIQIKAAGAVPVRSGTITVFDPCDHTWLDKSALPVATPVPRGNHEVFVALSGEDVLAVAVVFTSAREVVGWLPALLGDAEESIPTPPRFPMAGVRFSLGLADTALVEKIISRVIDENTGLPDGTHPTLEQVRSSLKLTPSRRKLVASHGGIVAIRCHRAPASWLGLDGSGAPRALLFDFAEVRRWASDLLSGPGLLLELASLSERFRLAGHATNDARALARSFLDRIDACGKNVDRFEPTEEDRSILNMPSELRRVALVEESLLRERGAPATRPVEPPSPDEALAMSVDELELSVGAANALRELEIETVGNLAALTEAELLRALERAIPKEKPRSIAHNRQRRILKEIVDVLADQSVSLRPE